LSQGGDGIRNPSDFVRYVVSIDKKTTELADAKIATSNFEHRTARMSSNSRPTSTTRRFFSDQSSTYGVPRYNRERTEGGISVARDNLEYPGRYALRRQDGSKDDEEPDEADEEKRTEESTGQQ
jgi:hypothetical protein